MNKKILILKNDRVGDLFHSLNGINAILNDNKDSQIEIILSPISKDLSFLFYSNNIKISYLPYHLNILDKFRLFLKIIFNSFDKIYILSPKNIAFINNLLVPYQKALKFVLSVKTSTLPRPIL